MDSSRELVAGIDLGGTKCLGVLADTCGTMVDQHQIAVGEERRAERALEEMLDALQTSARSSGGALASAAVGVPAVLDPQTGFAVRGPNAGWDGVDVGEIVGRIGVPYAMENDVNLAALAEGRVGAARASADYVVVSIGTGLGGAIVSGGRQLMGAHAGVGEFGEIPPLVPVPLDDPGPLRNLEWTLSGAGISASAARYVRRHPGAARELGDAPDARAVVAAAVRGSAAGRAVLAPVLDSLAYCVATLMAVVDPDLVILDGSVGRSLEPFRDALVREVARRTVTSPQIEVSQLLPNSTILGAVQRALDLVRPAGPSRQEGAQ